MTSTHVESHVRVVHRLTDEGAACSVDVGVLMSVLKRGVVKGWTDLFAEDHSHLALVWEMACFHPEERVVFLAFSQCSGMDADISLGIMCMTMLTRLRSSRTRRGLGGQTRTCIRLRGRELTHA